ncbi:hypothetical protein LS71_009360, partial [Helicobacter jaachi]
MLSKMSIGSKIVLSVCLVLAFCMGLLIVALISTSQHIQEDDARKLVENSAKRTSNAIEGYINEGFVSLNYSQYILSNYIHDKSLNENMAKNILTTLLDSNQWVEYGYIYLKNSALLPDSTSGHKLSNGGVMIVGHDVSSKDTGDVKILNANEVFLNDSGVQHALKSGKPSVGGPVKITIDGEEILSLSLNYPIKDADGSIQGVIGTTLDFDMIAESLFAQRRSTFKNDYRSLVTENGVFLLHPRSEFVGKSFMEIAALRDNPTIKPVVEALAKHESGVHEIENAAGENSIMGLASFEMGRNLTGQYLGVLVVAPTSSVYASMSIMKKIMVAGVLGCLITVSLFVFVYIRMTIARRIQHISHTLFEFFNYLNHKTNTPPQPLKIIAQDELGQMGSAINQNIEQTNKNLDQDTKAIEQSAQTAKEIESG